MTTPPQNLQQNLTQNLSLIVATSKNGVIGINNTLPWHLPEDLKRFRALTTGHHIIMGRKTYESLGRLLPNRTTIIVTRNTDYKIDGALIAHSLEAAILLAKSLGYTSLLLDTLPSIHAGSHSALPAVWLCGNTAISPQPG